jgi:hypothetical protein
MAQTVAQIAKAAFDAVAGSISGAIISATISDGSADVSGRVVMGGETAPTGFPIAKADSKGRPVYLEGFASVPAPGWTLTAGGDTYHIAGVRDIVEAGGLVVANVFAESDLLWASGRFERKTKTSDGAGGFTEEWRAISGAGSVPLGLVALSGNERWAAQRVEAASVWRAWCAPVDGLKEADRVVIDGLAYAITFVNDVEGRGVWQVIDLSRGVAT